MEIREVSVNYGKNLQQFFNTIFFAFIIYIDIVAHNFIVEQYIHAIYDATISLQCFSLLDFIY